MLAPEVLVQDVASDPAAIGIERKRAPGEIGDLFEDDRGPRGVAGRRSPGEGGVAGYEDAGDGFGYLQGEYARDLGKGLPIGIPQNYFPADDPSRDPLVRWRSHANLLFSNWLNYFVYQETPYAFVPLPTEGGEE